MRGADVEDLVVNAVGDGSVAEQAIVQMTILAHQCVVLDLLWDEVGAD